MVGPFDRRQPWEMTEPINPSGWVFNKPMPARPYRELLRNLVYSISRDGNYLLDVGPMQDGRLYPPDVARLAEFAAWMKTNAEGVHGTRGGPYRDGDWGGATCKGRNVFLFLSDRVGTELTLPAMAAKVRSARRLDGGPLEFSADRTRMRLVMPDRRGERPVFLGVKLDLDQDALRLPVADAQVNLAAGAAVTPSSVRPGWPVAGLFDNLGDTAWDTDGDALQSSLELDLGKVQPIGSASFSQRTQREGWHQYYRYELKARTSQKDAWQTLYRGNSCLGGIPVLELKPSQARYVRLEILKPRPGVPVQLAELRIFTPLPGAEK
jgi:alpha-L-fucosidase